MLGYYSKRIAHSLRDWYHCRVRWRGMPQARLIGELSLGNWGGCQLFIEDINGDGAAELLWLQSAGIFKSRVFADVPGEHQEYFRTLGQDFFCLTATRQSGEILWQIGEPYAGDHPYLSHAPERMVRCADVDGDGRKEVLVLDGSDQLLVLDGVSGRQKASVRLPADNFSVVECGRTGPNPDDVRILVGVMDRGYPPHSYGNPWLFLDGSLQTVHQADYLGAGHQVAIADVDGDGADEFLIGYQLVDHLGQVLWTLDHWRDRPIEPAQQHVDHVETCRIDGQWHAAVAGGDRQYWIDSSGQTIWSHPLPHPQFCLIGRSGSGTRVFVFNQRDQMNAFDLAGTETWRGLLPENWPVRRPPLAFSGRPIHSNEPATLLKAEGDGQVDLILYKEGGWPFVVDFQGRPVCTLPVTENVRRPTATIPYRRINDIGLSFEGNAFDLDGDGLPEVLIHDRSHLWVYHLDGELFERCPP